jgi:S-adenosyl methyltransferase
MSRKFFAGITPSRQAPVDLDTGVPHPALTDGDDPYGAVARLVSALAPGSYVAIQHATEDFYPPGAGSAEAFNRSGIPFQYRTKDEFGRFLTGLDLVPPGIVPMAEWRADDEPQPRPSPLEAGGYAAVARKD